MRCPYCDGTGEIVPDGVTVGALILSTRKVRGWTQEDLAARVGFSRAQIANIESGKSDMPIKSLKRFADAFGCHMRDLIPI